MASAASRTLTRPREDRGATAIEFLAIAAVLVTLLVMLIQFGLQANAYRVAQAAANEGAVATARFDGTAGHGQAVAENYLNIAGAFTIEDSTVSASRSGTEARVQVRIKVLSLPFVDWLNQPLTSTATVQVERYVP